MAYALPFFVIPETLASMAASSAGAANPVDHLGLLRYRDMTWKAATTGAAWVRGRFSGNAVRPVNFLSVLRANDDSSTIRLRLGTSQAEVDGASAAYDSGALPFTSPTITRSDGLYHSHLEIPAVYNASWWRIDFGTHSGNWEASKIILGKRLGLSRFWNPDWVPSVRDLGSIETSRFGVMHEETGAIFRAISVKLGWLTEAEFETLIRPLDEQAGQRGMIFYAHDPAPTTYRQSRTYFGPFREAPANPMVHAGRFEKQFQLDSII